MANFRDINSASRNLNRVMDINLEPENRQALEAVMVAMAAGGRVQEMAVIAQTIEKTSVQTDIVSAIADLKTVISGIKQPEPEVKAYIPKDTLTLEHRLDRMEQMFEEVVKQTK